MDHVINFLDINFIIIYFAGVVSNMSDAKFQNKSYGR